METKFEQLLRGELSAEESEKLMGKINSDDTLKKEFEEFKNAWEVAKTLERNAIREKVSKMVNHNVQRKKIRRWMPYSIAASIVFLLGLGYLFLWQSPTGPKLAQKYFEPYPDKYTSMGSDTSDMVAAMKYYNRENYPEAEKALETLEGKLAGAKFYRGICLIELDRQKEAKELLRDLAKDSSNSYHEASLWYLSLAHLNLQEVDSAILYLETLQSPNYSFHSKDAEEIVLKLQK